MLLDGVDLAAKTNSFIRKDPNFTSRASEEIFNLMIDEIVLGLCFDIHKSIKTGRKAGFLSRASHLPHPRLLLGDPADSRGRAPDPDRGARGRVRAARGDAHRPPQPQGGAADRVPQLQQQDAGGKQVGRVRGALQSNKA